MKEPPILSEREKLHTGALKGFLGRQLMAEDPDQKLVTAVEMMEFIRSSPDLLRFIRRCYGLAAVLRQKCVEFYLSENSTPALRKVCVEIFRLV
jgi:hypothetical protein